MTDLTLRTILNKLFLNTLELFHFTLENQSDSRNSAMNGLTYNQHCEYEVI